MNYIKVKNSQTIGSDTKDIDVLIPIDNIVSVSGNTTSVFISYSIVDSGNTAAELEYTISGFGTLASASEGFQTVYALIEDLAKSPNTVSDYLKINGDDSLTVVSEFP